ncbi:alpha/beta hydrolase-fold protein [Hydrotalea sp.]|uniref:alpha/beta hydrolase n=1 Tax=Hydrotalea sp. TaxID=2881279 RepID=UPI00261B3893|nr:alpha/beta hydrolase-fold protein [Hydrotalea sp.]
MPIETIHHATEVVVKQSTLYSLYLEREVVIDVYIPPQFHTLEDVSLLLVNDGQDLVKIPLQQQFNQLYAKDKLVPVLCIGIYCGEERKREYGVAYSADYLGRGDKAGLYHKFIFDELLPFIRKFFHAPSFKEKAFAGFSLGGLSALDIVWNHATEFAKVGIFSGSLWWRRKSYENGYNNETDRLMHLQVRNGGFFPWLQFFLQCGALDETADRNKNGVIDSVDDTLDLMIALKAKGYTNAHIHYLLVEGGKHDVATWANAMNEFLEWGWGR